MTAPTAHPSVHNRFRLSAINPRFLFAFDRGRRKQSPKSCSHPTINQSYKVVKESLSNIKGGRNDTEVAQWGPCWWKEPLTGTSSRQIMMKKVNQKNLEQIGRSPQTLTSFFAALLCFSARICASRAFLRSSSAFRSILSDIVTIFITSTLTNLQLNPQTR